MRLKLYKRAILSGLFGLFICFAFWLRPEGLLLQFSMPAYLFGALVSGNVHQPSTAATYAAIWAQWSLIAYAVSIVFFPRQARG